MEKNGPPIKWLVTEVGSEKTMYMGTESRAAVVKTRPPVLLSPLQLRVEAFETGEVLFLLDG